MIVATYTTGNEVEHFKMVIIFWFFGGFFGRGFVLGLLVCVGVVVLPLVCAVVWCVSDFVLGDIVAEFVWIGGVVVGCLDGLTLSGET